MVCEQFFVYTVIGLLSHDVHKHSSRSQHISVLTTCTLMLRQVCIIEPSFFNTPSGLHRRFFEGRYLVLFNRSNTKSILFLCSTGPMCMECPDIWLCPPSFVSLVRVYCAPKSLPSLMSLRHFLCLSPDAVFLWQDRVYLPSHFVSLEWMHLRLVHCLLRSIFAADINKPFYLLCCVHCIYAFMVSVTCLHALPITALLIYCVAASPAEALTKLACHAQLPVVTVCHLLSAGVGALPVPWLSAASDRPEKIKDDGWWWGDSP